MIVTVFRSRLNPDAQDEYMGRVLQRRERFYDAKRHTPML